MLSNQADALVGGGKAWLIIDDTALPKKGTASVGVAPQYASALGKNANCQTLVSVTLASREVPIMLGLRLFLPESWTNDEARMDKAGVPEPFRSYRTKPAIAIEEIDRVIAAGVRFGCVLADAGYGLSASFRQALSARGLRWAVGIPRHQKVYPADVQLIFPVVDPAAPCAGHRIARRSRHARGRKMATGQLAPGKGGTPERALCRHARTHCRRPAATHRRLGRAAHAREEAWLVGEHRFSGERKYYLSNLPADTPIRDIAGASKARWICEQAHQQLKEELGLDHFEGQSWTGLHRHALTMMNAYAFLEPRRLAQAGEGKRIAGPPPQPSLPAVRQAILDRLSRRHRPIAHIAENRWKTCQSDFCQSRWGGCRPPRTASECAKMVASTATGWKGRQP